MNKTLIKYLILIFMLLPFSYFFMWAFVERWNYTELLPEVFSVRAWIMLISNKDTVYTIFSSVLLSFTVAIVSVVCCYFPAKALAFYDFKIKNFFRLVLFIPIVLPVTSVAIGLHLNFLKLGLVNSVLGVIIVHVFFCIPYCILALEPVMSSVGKNYSEQASLLGAKPINVFMFIDFPLYLPGIIVAFFYSFVISFSQYFITYLIGGGKVKTYATIMFPIIREKDRQESAVYSIIFITICLLAYIVLYSFKKFFERRNN